MLAKNFEGGATGIPTEGVVNITEYMQEDGTLNWEAPEGKLDHNAIWTT